MFTTIMKHYPRTTFFILLFGMPVAILTAVSIGTMLTVLPFVWMMSWL